MDGFQLKMVRLIAKTLQLIVVRLVSDQKLEDGMLLLDHVAWLGLISKKIVDLVGANKGNLRPRCKGKVYLTESVTYQAGKHLR